MKDIKKDILWRIYLLYFFVFFFALAIIARVCFIQFAEGDKWAGKARKNNLRLVDTEENRGNVYAENCNSLLATSVPVFEIRMDLHHSVVDDQLFFGKIDSLSICLSRLFKDKSPGEYKSSLLHARRKQKRYHLVKRNVSYKELKQVRAFPVLRQGQYQGGMIVVQKNKRQMPFRMLAARTIGYDRVEDNNKIRVGIEGAYSDELSGKVGKRFEEKVDNEGWRPVSYLEEVNSRTGSDVITTLDVNIQDVAEHALLEQLKKHMADNGCVVLMEVQTGHVKAIANLTRVSEEGDYRETYNYAIGASSEPGSTFKLASLMAAMDDDEVDIEDMINCGNGSARYYDILMTDSEEKGHGRITIKEAFEVSSNVGISRCIFNAYSQHPERFVKKLYDMHLNLPLGVEILGERTPYIPNVGDSLWSKISLPWMSIGYGVRQTPLQILAFYNAVANDGVMVKPMFVKEIRKTGRVVKTFETEVLNESICTKETIRKARALLEGVVQNGTASALSKASYKIAGKTGTAQIANKNSGYNRINYTASFVGYFPADQPRYSCIVVVNNPKRGIIYGSWVAAPVFREVADRVYANHVDVIAPHVADEPPVIVPSVRTARAEDIHTVFTALGWPVNHAFDEGWVQVMGQSATASYSNLAFNDGMVPDVRGMQVKDALYLLESRGMRVVVEGRGRVKKQSILAGTQVVDGSKILLALGI